MIWLRLGLREWGRGIVGSTRDRSGRRDFFYLTALLAATLVLGVLLLGTREGMLNRFLDVSLGHMPGHGIPIWVYARYLGAAGGDDSAQGDVIDAAMTRRMEPLQARDGIAFYPYREVEYTQLRLPGYDPAFWSEAALLPWRDEGRPAPIAGRAVALDDPLWASVAEPAEEGALPLTVVLNRELFQRHFHCGDYLRALQGTIPPLLSPAPVGTAAHSAEVPDCLASGRLWLDARVTPVKRELLAFHIVWAAPRIPVMEEVALLLPLPTFNALQLAGDNPRLRYFPEAGGQAGRRIRGLGVWSDAADPRSDPQLQAFVDCLPRASLSGRRHNRIEFERAIPEAWPQRCAQATGIRLKTETGSVARPFIKIEQSVPGHALTAAGANVLSIACSALPGFERRELGCPNDKPRAASGTVAPAVAIDLRDRLGGYRFAQLYVQDRNTLLQAIERIETASGGVLTLRPEYQDAVIRFGFINDMVRVLRGAFIWVFGALLLVLLVIQIMLVITHRRHNYGVFIANGMAPGQVLAMVCTQVGLSYLLAFGIAFGVFQAIRMRLLGQVEAMLAATSYRDHIAISDPDLLPVSLSGLLGPAALGLGLTLVTALVIMMVVLRPWPWRGSPEPARLLYS